MAEKRQTKATKESAGGAPPPAPQAAAPPPPPPSPPAAAAPPAPAVSAPQAAAPHGGGYRGGGPSRGPPRSGERRGRSRFIPRRKVCSFCVEHITAIDYKRVDGLRRYLSERGKIEPRRKTGTCAKHQRMLTQALKRARHLALLPYTLQHVLDSGIEVGIHRSY